MSQDARDYVRTLGKDRIDTRQKALLFCIADMYSDRYKSANFALEDLCHDMLLDRRRVQRLIKSLVELGIVWYKPGRGSGNFSEFRLPEFERQTPAFTDDVPTRLPGKKVVKRWSKGGQKVVSETPAIRKDLVPNPNRDSPLLVPPSSKGNVLNIRDRRRLNEEVWLLMDKDAKTDFDEALRIACARLLLPLEAAQDAAIFAGLEDAIKRRTLRKPVQAAV